MAFLWTLSLFLLPARAPANPAVAVTPEAGSPLAHATLEELLARQAELEATASTSPALTQVNFALARKSREMLLARGFQVGTIVRDSGNPSVFRFPLLAGPEGSNLGNVIREASDRFHIGYVIELGPIHYGSYDDPKKLVRLSPRFLSLNAADMFNTILHETRHAFFWAMGAAGKTSPFNVDVVAKGNTALTDGGLYLSYFHFQEMEAHARDFHQAMSGVPSNYLLEGFSPEEVVRLKRSSVLSFTRAVNKHSKAAIRSLQSGLASQLPLDRNGKLSRSGMVLIVPVAKPKATTPYAYVRILMPGVGKEVPDSEVRQRAIAILKGSIKAAKRRATHTTASFAAFQAHPIVGPAPCRERFRILGTGK